ncbi:MAG: T9SS type A sorting domain-containing protein [Ignavibacteriaceae bacterium]|jgi:hypothetical protein
MKSIFSNKMFFNGIIIYIFINSFTLVLPQTIFTRDDNFDIQGIHELTANTDPILFKLFIDSDSDFPLFKLHIRKDRLDLTDFRFWLVKKYKVHIDGVTVQDWTSDNEKTISYVFPNPTNGISANHTISIQIDYMDDVGDPLGTLSDDIPITIFAKPRVYKDSENNSFVQLRDEDATAKIPVLIVEGFDPTNDNLPELYYNLTWELINTDLYPNGYEVFILNFNNGGRDLRLNAEVLLKAIEKVHQLCPNFKIAVAGLSMGGTIARYALAKSEGQGGTHNVGLLLSYDSPQQWAHISPDLQDWIKIQDPNDGAIGILQANLQSMAAKQILFYDTYDPNTTNRLTFYNELNTLNGNGYPHQSYNVAVSNGNFNAFRGFGQVGRHVMTLKINNNLIKDVPAVQNDCGTGSMITNLTTKRYGDIFSSPFLHIFYDLEIIFNPTFIPTYSSLDLVNTVVNTISGDITSFERSKFDEYVVQTTPVQHHVLTDVTRTNIMNWLNKDFNIDINYNLPNGGSTNSDSYPVKILHGIPITVQPKNVNVNGKQVTYNFAEWSDGDKNNPRTFYTSHDIVQTATMKGSLLSDNSAGFSSNSQRKFISDVNGNKHLVYESQGSVWYTRSTNNGSTWLPEIKISEEGALAKGATIALDNGCTYILYQSDHNTYPDPIPTLILQKLSLSGIVLDRMEVCNLTSYSYNTMAVLIAESNIVLVVYRPDASSGLVGKEIILNNNNFSTSTVYDRTITGTTQYSTNPALAVTRYGNQSRYMLVYQESYYGIYYKEWNIASNFTNLVEKYPSSGVGYSLNSAPSIVDVTTGSRLCWVGSNYSGTSKRVVFRDPGNQYQFWTFGNSVASPSINKTDANTAYFIGWSDGNGASFQIVDNHLSYSYIKTLTGLQGSAMQLSNGSGSNTMYAMTFYNGGLPYALTQSNSLASYYSMSKENTNSNIASGRAGIVMKGEGEFSFMLGDIEVNGEKIRFKKLSDTLTIPSKDVFNTLVESEPFELKENTDFTYSIEYGVTDSALAAQALQNGENVKFKVELVDALTNQIINTFDNVTYTKDFLQKYNSLAYQVNTEAIGTMNVKLRLVADHSGDANYLINNSFVEDEIIAKKGFKVINLKNELQIKDYTLAQNYPNPFNPVTTITYQLPKSGSVTLKIFDILGNEVKTLVNENKEMGRYTVQFDASSLASGMYVYQLRANDYTSTKKMMLLK